MDGEGDSELKIEINSTRCTRDSQIFLPQRTVGEDERLEVREDATQSTNLQPVGDWISIQMQLAYTFMGTRGLSIAVAAR